MGNYIINTGYGDGFIDGALTVGKESDVVYMVGV